MSNTSKMSVLQSEHERAGAKFTQFAGYNLPIWFSTMKDEHLAVRNSVGMFDISHMGMMKLSGEQAFDFIHYLSCNDATKSLDATIIYSMFLNESGFILDDVMFGCLDKDFYLIVNGANFDKIYAWMNKNNRFSVQIERLNSTHTLVAVQGPQAAKILQQTFLISVDTLKPFGMQKFDINSQTCVFSRTGYTGEDGFECMIPHSIAADFWKKLLENGVTPCGLAARDTLRIEYGLPLYGQELSEEIHPFMTRYSWVVKFNHDFIGKAALEQLKGNETLKSVGLELHEELIARPHYAIKEGGYISSGTLSPISNKSIALAFVPKELAVIGSIVTVYIRKNEVKASVVRVPFVTRN